MLHRIAVVVAGAAGVRVAVELERIGGFETAHDARTSQDCARESETGEKFPSKRMHNLH
jgi:hypothetical protein